MEFLYSIETRGSAHNPGCSAQQGRDWFQNLVSSIEGGRGRHHLSITSGWRYIFLGSKSQYNCASRTYFITNLKLLKETLFQYYKNHIGHKIKRYKFLLAGWGWLSRVLFCFCFVSFFCQSQMILDIKQQFDLLDHNTNILSRQTDGLSSFFLCSVWLCFLSIHLLVSRMLGIHKKVIKSKPENIIMTF